jgi:hypothetical protein
MKLTENLKQTKDTLYNINTHKILDIIKVELKTPLDLMKLTENLK